MVHQIRSNLLVAVGSNCANGGNSPADALKNAAAKIEAAGAVIRAKSAIYNSPAFPAGSGADYANAVFALDAHWPARAAITTLHAIEAEMGRRRQKRWEARHIDLDLIAIGNEIRPNLATVRHWMDLDPALQQETAPADLILPHPRLHERAFVLVPLAEIAPDWVHPVLRRNAAQLRDALPAQTLSGVVPIENGWGDEA
ncbi:MAG: 2-amino-4-hydroxy-6-hydroxymethyldihydropteridine diphosphokinase [Pseudomonadota bacterium]